jgi:hypothetical protein
MCSFYKRLSVLILLILHSFSGLAGKREIMLHPSHALEEMPPRTAKRVHSFTEDRRTNFFQPETLEDNLLYSTVRIECANDEDTEEKIASVGTGYIIQLSGKSEDASPGTLNGDYFLVTNRHVIFKEIGDKQASKGYAPKGRNLHLYFHFLSKDKLPKMCKVCMPKGYEKNFKYDVSRDMCALWLNTLLSTTVQRNIGKIFFVPLRMEKNLWHEQEEWPTKPGDQVAMIGYPNGLWDDTNNYPIIRQGHVATSPQVDYKGKKEFLLDIALYPGSSGSPIVFIEEKQFIYLGELNDKLRFFQAAMQARLEDSPQIISPTVQKKVYFLGMVYGGPSDQDFLKIRRSIASIKEDMQTTKAHVASLQIGLNELKEHASQDRKRLEELEEDIRTDQASPGSSSSDEESSKAISIDETDAKQFSNLAYVIKESEIIYFLNREVNELRQNTSISNLDFFIATHLSDLLKRTPEELKKDSSTVRHIPV